MMQSNIRHYIMDKFDYLKKDVKILKPEDDGEPLPEDDFHYPKWIDMVTRDVNCTRNMAIRELKQTKHNGDVDSVILKITK